MARGGKRPGAGRPKNSSKLLSKKPMPSQQSETVYETAEDYLAAVVCGTELPDPGRIAAAKAILPYQTGRKRAPMKSNTPRQLQLSESLKGDAKAREEWLRKSEEVRSRHKKSQLDGNK